MDIYARSIMIYIYIYGHPPPTTPQGVICIAYIYIYLHIPSTVLFTYSNSFFHRGGTTRRPSWRAAKVIRIGSRQKWRPRSAQVLGEGHFSHAKSSEVTTYMMFF